MAVLADNRFNADPHTGRVLVAPLGRRPAPVSVPCGDQDPIGGFVHIAELGQAGLGSLADAACMVSGHTLGRINRALVSLFDLPYQPRSRPSLAVEPPSRPLSLVALRP